MRQKITPTAVGLGHTLCQRLVGALSRTSGWSSKKIAITIRMYPGAQYNARVYNQHCWECNNLCNPRLTDSYAKRVAHRLKKWSGIEMDQPIFLGNSKGPHESELCEGCKNGHCSQSNRVGLICTASKMIMFYNGFDI